MNRIYKTAKKPEMHKHRDGRDKINCAFNFTNTFYGEKYNYQRDN